MFRKLTLSAVAALALTAGQASAAGSEAHIEDFDFSFEGPFGSYDQMQLQRGLQIYSEICSSCHGLKRVALRTLEGEAGMGWTDDQVRAYIEDRGMETFDPALFDGEGDFRPSTPADHFPAGQDSTIPDLSLMAKARAGFHGPYGTGISQFVNGMGGAEYIASILSGYTGEEKEEAGTILYENTAFPGGWIGMAPPLYDGAVEFADGHSSDIHHMAEDAAAFLMWTAEPKLVARKQAGLTGVLFLTILSVLLYLTNKKIWAPHKRKH